MKSIIVSTCGHIDHGKTYLTEKLTGKNTMHTKEEIKRSITIDLGYARTKIKDLNVNITDVPGHEDYLKNTICGLLNSDFSILAVSATEGVSNQTIQHFEALELIGFSCIIIAITKVDIADKSQIEKTKKQILNLIENTNIKNIDIIEINYKNEDSILSFKELIYKNSKDIKNYSSSPLLITIDNSFTIKGIGTVISGNLLRGKIKKDQKLYIYPIKRETKAKIIQYSHSDVDELECKNRVAINIPDIKKEEIKRGYVIRQDNLKKDTKRIDCLIKTSKNLYRNIKNYEYVKLFTGTANVNAKIVNIQKKPISKNSNLMVKLILKEPVFCSVKDKVLILDTTANQIIAGGIIINTEARKKTNEDSILFFEDTDQLIINHLLNENLYIDEEKLFLTSNTDSQKYKNIIEDLQKNSKIKNIEGLIIKKENYNNLKEKIENYIGNCKKNISFLEMTSIYNDFNYVDIKISDNIIKDLGYEIKSGKIILNEDKLDEKDKKTACEIKKYIEKSDKPVKITDVTKNKKENLNILFTKLRENFVKLNDEYICSKKSAEKYKDFIKKHFEKNEKLMISDIKEKFDLNRKQSLSILEYTDNEKITKRFENYRIKSYNSKD